MPDHLPATDAPLHDDIRYEKTDEGIRVIVIFALCLFFFIAILHGLVTHLFTYFQELETRENRLTHPITPLAAKERPQFPKDLAKIPGPRLQKSETHDMDELRQREEAHLHSYGWIDPKAGTLRLPIAEAMKRMADPATSEAHGLRVKGTSK